MRYPLVALFVLDACVSPPATPDLCRDEISIAYASDSLSYVAHQTLTFEDFARHSTGKGPDRDWPGWMRYRAALDRHLRDDIVELCIADQWPANVPRCFGHADSAAERGDCARALPRRAYRKLEDAALYLDRH